MYEGDTVQQVDEDMHPPSILAHTTPTTADADASILTSLTRVMHSSYGGMHPLPIYVLHSIQR